MIDVLNNLIMIMVLLLPVLSFFIFLEVFIELFKKWFIK
jgi:hypothetical protein